MTDRLQLLRNTSLSFSLNLVNKAANAIAFIVIARQAGASQAGVFSLAITYILIFTAFSIGMDELLIRQVARDRTMASRYFGSFLFLRLLMTIGLYIILFVVVSYGFDYAPTTTTAILIMGFSIIPEGLNFIGQALLTSHERFNIPVLAAAVSGGVKLGGVFLISLARLDPVYFGWVWIFGSTLGAAINFSAAIHISGTLNPGEWLDRDFWTSQLKFGVLFLGIGALATLEYQTDVLILSAVRPETDLGWYGAATTIIFSLAIVPQAYRTAVYPLMVRYNEDVPASLDRVFDLSFSYLGIAALPIAVGITLLSQQIIVFVYGPDFLEAVLPLAILSWALVFIFLNVPNSRLMLVKDRQSWSLRFLLGSLSINLILNILLDPYLGATGAAIARLIAVIVFFVPNYWYVIHNLHSHNIFTSLGRVAMAALIMGISVWLTRDLGLWIAIFVGIVMYTFALIILKALPGEEKRWMIETIDQLRQKLGKVG
jgi:O-antigen/teichoic acid export membrane protein